MQISSSPVCELAVLGQTPPPPSDPTSLHPPSSSNPSSILKCSLLLNDASAAQTVACFSPPHLAGNKSGGGKVCPILLTTKEGEGVLPAPSESQGWSIGEHRALE